MSTADLFIRVVRATPVAREQDHLRILVDNNPKIPDRTEALRSGDTAPAREALCETARNLERAGAELIGIPCNTAHAFLADIRSSVAVPVIDMVDEAASRARERFGERTVVGLLATDGTLAADLYGVALERHGLVAAEPGAEAQAIVMGVIDEVKVRDVSEGCMERLTKVVEDLSERGATCLIAGCTEISLVLSHHAPGLPWLDPLQALADALVTEATGRSPYG
jgi:aspartate racemase